MKLSEADIKSFVKEQENVNTKKKTFDYSTSSLQVRTKGENFKKFMPPNYISSR